MNFAGSSNFFASVLDSLTQQIAVIDAHGIIQWVNRSWRTFAEENGGPPSRAWRGMDYLGVCSTSASDGEQGGGEALAGIRSVIDGEEPAFYFEYPCHSSTERRWFMMGVCPLHWDGPEHFVVTHQNITQRKLAELKVEELAVLDGLTGIANRRKFDSFLEGEWRRARRLGQPMSMALFDIDFFKAFNDAYGHTAGDQCLRRVGQALDQFSRRPDDLVARYGGEEFAAVLGNTDQDAAWDLAKRVRGAIEALGIPHEHATPAGCVTVSVGVATMRPDTHPDAGPADLIEAADRALYRAKGSGRNRVCASAAVAVSPEPMRCSA